MAAMYLILCSFGAVLHVVAGFKPVVLVHGLLSNVQKFKGLHDMIVKAHPGTQVTVLKLYENLSSLEPMDRQLDYLMKKLVPIMSDSIKGIHLVCHSQGGLLCRGAIENLPKHNVHSMILLGTPFVGQFGIPGLVKKYLPFLKGEREELTRWMYTYLAQSTLSFANYWRDPRLSYRKEYQKECKFLPRVDNNPGSISYNASDAKLMKAKFVQLEKVVLVGGKDDGVIIPWQSSLAGFYDTNYKMLSFKQQQLFIEDWFGLRTIYQRGNLYVYNISGVHHDGWHKNHHVFQKAIEPYLD